MLFPLFRDTSILFILIKPLSFISSAYIVLIGRNLR